MWRGPNYSAKAEGDHRYHLTRATGSVDEAGDPPESCQVVTVAYADGFGSEKEACNKAAQVLSEVAVTP